MKGVLVFAAIVAGIALMWFLSAGQAGVECEACMTFGGRTHCGTARGADEAEARRSAISTACAPLTRGVTETLDCDRAAPHSLRCETVGGL